MECLRPWIFVALLFSITSCGGGSENDSTELARSIPLVDAPLDTTNIIVATQESTVAAAGSGAAIRDPSWIHLKMAGYPPLDDLEYVRYENAQLRFSIAYPDSILKPGEPIGEGRGMEFASRGGEVRMLVFGIEKSTREDLETEYRSTLEGSAKRITYRAREELWYVVSGREEDEVFYEKAVLKNGTLCVFRIHYPFAAKAYFDAVTAIMAASIEE